MNASKTASVPFHGGHCYACSSRAVGFRDMRPEGRDIEPACSRHADPAIRVYHACQYCDGSIRKGSLDLDGLFAHAKCHAEQN